ncbi:Uncharacterised protein [Halioglobus japonicus]|nr:Uncharacterised protein [Halioglobus japonicus]
MIAYIASVWIALFTLLISNPSAAGNQHEGHSKNAAVTQDAHVHGVAELLVVLEDDQLEIALHTPAQNLLGFEQHAQSAEQVAMVEHTKTTLANADDLFQFDPALCHLANHTTDFGAAAQGHNVDEKGAEEHDNQAEATTHSNIEARYRFRCELPDQLISLSTGLSDVFPDIRLLHAQWIAGGRQGAITLDNDQRTILFR